MTVNRYALPIKKFAPNLAPKPTQSETTDGLRVKFNQQQDETLPFPEAPKEPIIADELTLLRAKDDEFMAESSDSCCYQIDTTQPQVVSQVIQVAELDESPKMSVEYNRHHFRKMWYKVEDMKK